MKYVVSFNQKVYEVNVDKISGGQAPTYVAPTQPMTQAPVTPVVQTPVAPAMPVGGANTEITSPMPGKVMTLSVSVGQVVAEGQCLAIIEAMKMENEIVAPSAGTVKQVLVSQGTNVDTGDVLIVLN